MIQTEELVIGSTLFIRTWSNAGRYVVREGISYTEAYDPAEFNRIYTEGDLIPPEEIEQEEGKTIG